MYKKILYEVSKIIAESDSIGEGYPYCPDYTSEEFEKELNEIGQKSDKLLSTYVGVAIDILKVVSIYEP